MLQCNYLRSISSPAIRSDSKVPSCGNQSANISCVVPSRTPAYAGKSGAVARRGRSILAPGSPYISLIRGADGGAAH